MTRMSNTAHFSLTVFLPVHNTVAKIMLKNSQPNPVWGVIETFLFTFSVATICDSITSRNINMLNLNEELPV